MSITSFHILHLSAIFVLLGYTFYAFAAPAESRRCVLMTTGIASVLVLVSGFGMLHAMGIPGLPGWVIIKLVCWLGLSALGGIAYKRRSKSCLLMILGLVLAITAVAMVYVKPSL